MAVSTPILFTFGAMESMLATVHGIAGSKRTAFQARLKNFHRLGYPLDLTTQKGKAALYNPGQVIEMALALEMAQLGIPPERVVRVLTINRFPTFMALSMAARALFDLPEGYHPDYELESDPLSMFLFFDPAALSSLMIDDPIKTPDIDFTDDTFFYGGAAVVGENLVKWTSGGINRLSLINVTAMTDVVANTAWTGGLADVDGIIEFKRDFFSAALKWADEKQEVTYEHDADHFLQKLMEQTYPSIEDPSSRPAREVIDQLIRETGLRPKTIEKALIELAKKVRAQQSKGRKNGDR